MTWVARRVARPVHSPRKKPPILCLFLSNTSAYQACPPSVHLPSYCVPFNFLLEALSHDYLRFAEIALLIDRFFASCDPAGTKLGISPSTCRCQLLPSVGWRQLSCTMQPGIFA